MPKNKKIKNGFTPLEISMNKLLTAQNINKHRKFLTGFTLIELLVVVAIIGILATIVTVVLSNSRARARDARRNSEMHQISLAMELYYNSNNQSYAGAGNATGSLPWSDGFGTSCATAGVTIIQKGSTIFMGVFPTDPSTQTYYCSDAAQTNGQTYCVWVQKETDTSMYVMANKNGSKETSTVPTNLASCNQ